MTRMTRILCSAALTLGALGTAHAQTTPAPAAPAPIVKIWQAPAYKTRAQAVIDAVWAQYAPDMTGITFHAKPAGMDRYVMMAGTWPDRVGKASGGEDIVVAERGVILLDPRYGMTDPEPRFQVIVPLRDQTSKNIGAIVFGFKNPPMSGRTSSDYVAVATFLRDQMQKHIPSAPALYERFQ